MEVKILLVTFLVATCFHIVLTLDSISRYQDEVLPLPNITLDIKYENNSEWTFPRDTILKWFEYYNDTSIFKNQKENNSTCGESAKNFEELSETEGIWVACQDTNLPAECAISTKDPCHPLLSCGTSFATSLRTVKMTFALHGFAILRLNAGPQCFDYTLRQDTFSPCEYLKIDAETGNEVWNSSTTVKDGWISSQLIYNPYSNTGFDRFTLELIARFTNDAVLLDKVEGSQYILCKDQQCSTTTQPTTPKNDTYSIMPTTSNATTTEDEGITDPDVDFTSTTPRNTSILLISNFGVTIFSIIILTLF